MAITNPDYSVGTVSITTGTKVLTGVGTMWMSADLEKGDQFGFDGYAPARIDTINNDGSITLLDTWRGPTLTTSPYFIRYQADGSGLTGQSVALRRMLSQPLLTAFAGLAAAADKLTYFTGANTMALVDFKAWARSLLGLTPAANKGVYFTDANTAALYDLTTAGRALLDDANADAQLTTLGFSTYIKTLVNAANAAAARTILGAQAALGFTPANAAGQVFTGQIEVPNNISLRAPRVSGTVGATNNGGVLTSFIGPDVGQLSAQFFASEIVGTAVRAGISANAGGAISYLLFTHTGNLAVPGVLSKGSGTFLIDHPLDPSNKDLAHGFVEAPRYELIYRGRAKLIDGRATVDIDACSHMTTGTFAALTINAEVTSLQNQDGFSRLRPTAVSGGSFEIICEDETSTDEVAWVVIAERNDAFVRVMDDNCDDEGRFIPERDKPE